MKTKDRLHRVIEFIWLNQLTKIDNLHSEFGYDQCPNIFHEPLPSEIYSKIWGFLIEGRKINSTIVL